MAKRLTEEQILYIQKHQSKSPTALAQMLGCSTQTIFAQFQKLGIYVVADRAKQRERKRRKILKLYPTHSAAEIAAILDVPKYTVSRIAKQLGLQHTPETLERLLHKGARIADNPQSRAKRSESIRRTIRLEHMRLDSGLPQKTRRHLRRVTNKSLCARNYLIRAYNYIYDKHLGELLSLFYDSETRRLPPERERHYEETYNIHFWQADE